MIIKYFIATSSTVSPLQALRDERWGRVVIGPGL